MDYKACPNISSESYSELKRFQYISDLHLDVNKLDTVDKWPAVVYPVAKNLILAGDIAHLTWEHFLTFLKYCSDNWTNVFLVLGNHDYYRSDIYDLDRLRKMYPLNVYVLDKNVYVLNSKDQVVQYSNVAEYDKTRPNKHDILILGCTLWSFIPPKAELECRARLPDFRAIKDMTVDRYNRLHFDHSGWLYRQLIHAVKSKRIIIVTHHAPLTRGVSAPKYEADESRCFNYAFCSDQTELMELMPPNSYWVYGHTHYRTSLQVEKVTIVSNAYGYLGEIKGPVNQETFD